MWLSFCSWKKLLRSFFPSSSSSSFKVVCCIFIWCSSFVKCQDNGGWLFLQRTKGGSFGDEDIEAYHCHRTIFLTVRIPTFCFVQEALFVLKWEMQLYTCDPKTFGSWGTAERCLMIVRGTSLLAFVCLCFLCGRITLSRKPANRSILHETFWIQLLSYLSLCCSSVCQVLCGAFACRLGVSFVNHYWSGISCCRPVILLSFPG